MSKWFGSGLLGLTLLAACGNGSAKHGAQASDGSGSGTGGTGGATKASGVDGGGATNEASGASTATGKTSGSTGGAATGGGGASSGTGGGAGEADTSAAGEGGSNDTGETDGGGTSSGLAPIAMADFPAALAAAYCASISECCSNGTNGCEAEMTSNIKDMLDQGAAADNVYDPDSAAECVAAVEAIGASPGERCVVDFQSISPELGACDATLDGKARPGDSCDAVTDCQHGRMQGTFLTGYVACIPYGGVDATRCRAFVPTTEVGTACDALAGSATTTDCCSDQMQCVAGECQPLPERDEPCPNYLCAADLSCVANSCAPLAGVGDDCSSAVCASGEVCDESSHCAADPNPWGLTVGFWAASFSCPG